MLQTAWNKGFDAAGAKQFNWKIIGTGKWIGTTEIACVLRSMSIDAQILDFDHINRVATKKMGLLIADQVKKYFDQDSPFGPLPPLYFQYQG